VTGFAEMFETQRPVFFHWVPVALGTGIGAYFAAMEEPPVWLGAACLLAAIIGLVGAWRMPMLRIGVWVLVLASLGFTLATWRAQSVAAPVLEYRYYGPVEGRIAGISRSYGNALRVTLDRVRLKDSARTAPLPVETEREGGVGMWLFGKRTVIAEGIREARFARV